MASGTSSGEVGATGSRPGGVGHLPRALPPGHARDYDWDSNGPDAGPSTAVLGSPNKPTRPPRPMNAWLLFRTAQVKHFQNQNPDERRAQGQLSKVIAEMWRAAPVETRRQYEELAKEKKEEHARMYPDYRYTPRDKPTKKKNSRPSTKTSKPAPSLDVALPSTALSTSAPNNAPPRPPSSASASSSRSQVPSQVGYHPYGARPSAPSPLPRIDTSHATSTWQPGPPLSAAIPFSNQTWQSLGATPTEDEHQSYRGPMSAPAEYPMGPNDLQRQGYGADAPLYAGVQYSPSWPSASSTQSHLQYPASTVSAHSRDSSFPDTATSRSPPENVPTFDYSFYRAPTSSYHTPPSPALPPSNTPSLPYRSTSSHSSSSLHPPALYDYAFHDQSSHNAGSEIPPTYPPRPKFTSTASQEHLQHQQQPLYDPNPQYEHPSGLQEREEWPIYRETEQMQPRPPYTNHDPPSPQPHSQLHPQQSQQQGLQPHPQRPLHDRQSFYAQAQSASSMLHPHHSSASPGSNYPPPLHPPPQSSG
ncbi:hypothetical protein JCM11491_004294 [Sporobolomyces phaffii]